MSQLWWHVTVVISFNVALMVLLLLVVFQKDWIILGPVVLVLKGNLSSAENSGVSEVSRAQLNNLPECLSGLFMLMFFYFVKW